MKPLSKKELKKREMEELDALLGSSNPAIEKKADAPVVSAEAGEGKKKKKKNKTKETSED